MPSTNKPTALVVDDYATMRRKLVTAVRGLGYSVSEAQNGVEALTRLRESSFDLLFTDLVMPEMDGFELCQEVRKIPELIQLPVIVVSTHCDSRYVVRALRLGADDYIPKPFSKHLVRRVIDRVMAPGLEGAQQ